MSKKLTTLLGLFCLATCFCACATGKKSNPEAATSEAVSSAQSDPYSAATKQFYDGDYAGCIDSVTEIMNQSGETAQGLTLRGIAQVKAGMTYSAFRDLLAVTKMSYTADSLMNLGNALRMSGYCVRAADAYEQALALRPGDPKILVNLTSSYLCYGNIEAANQSYGQLVGKLPTDVVALTVAGTVSAMADNFEQARIAAQKALEYDAEYRPALRLLSVACQNLKNTACAQQAEKQYRHLSNRLNRTRKPVGEQL